MATAYVYLVVFHASNSTGQQLGVREFGDYEPHRQLVSVGHDTAKHRC